MITSYAKPQDTITLLREVRQNGVARRRNPVVIGPRYLLSRFGSETLPAVAFTGQTSQALWYDLAGVTTALPATYGVDIDDVKLWASNLLLPLLVGAEPTWSQGANARQLRCSQVVSGETLGAAFGTRGLKVGDVLLIDDSVGGDDLIRRRITGFLGVAEGAKVGTDVGTDSIDNDDERFAANAYNPIATTASTNPGAAVDAIVDGGDAAISTATFSLTDWTANVGGLKYATEAAAHYTVSVTDIPDSVSVEVTVTRAGSAWSTTATAELVGTDYVFSIYDPDASATGDSLGGLIELTVEMNPGKQLELGSTITLTAKSTYVPSAYVGAGKLEVIGGTFSDTIDTVLVVEVTAGGAADSDTHAFRVRDTRGRMAVATYTFAEVDGGMSVSQTFSAMGLTVLLPAAAYRKGDVFYIICTAAKASTTNFDGVTLDGPAFDANLYQGAVPLDVTVYYPYTGLVPVDACASYTLASGVLTFGALNIEGDEITTNPEVGYGTLSIGFRAIEPVPTSESLIAIESSEDIEPNCGPIDLDNPSAYSVQQAFSGTQGDMVYFLRTAGLTAADFSAALLKVSATDLVYAFTQAGTDDTTVLALLRTHMEAQSVPTKKNFRRVYLGVDSPGSYRRVGPDSNGVDRSAQFLAYGTDGNIHVVFDEDVDLVAAGVRVGDLVRVTIDSVVTDFAIAEVMAPAEEGTPANQALLVTGPATEIAQGISTEVWAADTADNQIDYLVAVAASLASSRAILVWCEGGTTIIDGEVASVSSQHIAAEIAGLRCALVPQAGITSYEISTVSAAAPMYTRYSEEQLNRAAASGVFIVTQEIVGGPVFIRHQLTTDTDNGILYWEDSVGVNHDDLGFQVKDAFVGFKGRKNVTETTRREIEDDLYQIAVNATQGAVDAEYGPQISGFSDEKGVANKVTVRRHPQFADRFITFFRPGMPVPLNGIDHTIYGEISELV